MFTTPNHGADGRISDPRFQPTAHIFYTSGIKDIKDGLPKYVDLPAGFGGSDDTVEEDYHRLKEIVEKKTLETMKGMWSKMFPGRPTPLELEAPNADPSGPSALPLVQPGKLTFVCAAFTAWPVFKTDDVKTQKRSGYEPEAAQLIARKMGMEIDWVFAEWWVGWNGLVGKWETWGWLIRLALWSLRLRSLGDRTQFKPLVLKGKVDAHFCGSAITPERKQYYAYTRPYIVVDEQVLVKKGSGITGFTDLAGKKIAAISGSTNYKLAETYVTYGATPVGFDGANDDVLGEMMLALDEGKVDAVIDDDCAFGHLVGEGSKYEIAWTAQTGWKWWVDKQASERGAMASLEDVPVVDRPSFLPSFFCRFRSLLIHSPAQPRHRSLSLTLQGRRLPPRQRPRPPCRRQGDRRGHQGRRL